MATTQQQTNGNNTDANPTVVDGAVKNFDKVQDATPPKDPRGSDKRFLEHVSHPVLVDSITRAAGSFKTAINLEVAVCFAVYASFKGVNIRAKKELYSVYKDAGYDCEPGGKGKDYKTVQRRIGYVGDLFEAIGGVDTAVEFMEGKKDVEAVQALVNHFTTEYNFRSMNDVLWAAGIEPPEVAARRKAVQKVEASAAKTVAEPAPDADEEGDEETEGAPVTDNAVASVQAQAQDRVDEGKEPTGKQEEVLKQAGIEVPAEPAKFDEADMGVAAAISAEGVKREGRRSTDNENWIRAQFDGVTMFIPKNVKPDVLMDLGLKLMEVSRKVDGGNSLVELLTEAFAEQAAH